jgi:hypothetical protein
LGLAQNIWAYAEKKILSLGFAMDNVMGLARLLLYLFLFFFLEQTNHVYSLQIFSLDWEGIHLNPADDK